MRKDAKRASGWFGRIEHLEERLAMSADPLGGAIIHHDLIEEPPALEHHQEATPDFWIESSDQEFLDQTLQEIEQALATAHNFTGLTTVRNTYGFTGIGQTVAVIDSGIAYDHFALGGGYGSNYRVVGGWDFTGENDNNPYDDGPEGSHGTHVAGIVGAAGGTNSGVAPGVDLVGLRVFDDAGAGFYSWVEKALQWVHTNRNNFENPITAVNLSLGVSSWNAETIPNWATLEDEFAQLEADGIFIAVSAGNAFTSYNTPGLSYPAASPYVVPVMSVDDNGVLSNFSQRSTRAIAAPGRTIVSTVPDYVGNNNGITDDYASFSGTSMASPYVAGSSVIIRQAMQFAGYTNITQDMIYNHMVATADQVFDSVTNQTYNRLNMSAAINALMPTDDYGSTTGAAFNLGTLGASRELSGVISTLADNDYFRFTAGSTGTVTFAASNLTHELAAEWFGSGQASGANNQFYTLDVVAGQTYTVGFSSAAGLGYYDLDITSEANFTYTDWGNVGFSQIQNLNLTGENWYKVRSTTGGYLTIDASYTAANGSVTLGLYSSNMQHLSTGNAVNGTSRVDVYCAASTDYYICVQGTNNDIDFRLTNLVSVDGTTVNVAGTTGNDIFGFAAGATHQLSVNGVTYSFAANSVSTINFAGGAGTDSITMIGTAGDDIATLQVGSSSLVGAGYTVNATATETVAVVGGEGFDRAYLFDSAGNDRLTAWPTIATMTGTNFSHSAVGFQQVSAYATAGGEDRADFYDGAGNDRFYARANQGEAYMTGTNFINYAQGFDQNLAFATAGGMDRADFYDGAGNDRFYMRAAQNDAYMTGAGFYNYAQGFEQNLGFATAGGTDRVDFYDGAGNDRYYVRPAQGDAYMTGTGFYNFAQSFEQSIAFATAGGVDRADFYDSAGDDRFYARALQRDAYMTGAGFYNYTQGFEQNMAFATLGGLDRADFYDSAGDDRFYARALQRDAYMTGTDFYNFAQSFEQNMAFSTGGGFDRADFYDSAGDDRYYTRAQQREAYMYGTGFYNLARGFYRNMAFATAGGNDLTLFYDSAGNDSVNVYAGAMSLEGNGVYSYSQGFDYGHAYSTQGYDQVLIDTLGTTDLLTGLDALATVYRPSALQLLEGFDSVSASALDPDSIAIDSNAVDYIFAVIGA